MKSTPEENDPEIAGHIANLEALIDGKFDDSLGNILTPIRDFLKRCRTFQLEDSKHTAEKTPTTKVTIVPHPTGLDIDIEGYGNQGMEDGCGTPVYLDTFDGKPIVYVWADINEEEPTHKLAVHRLAVNLSGAKESERVD